MLNKDFLLPEERVLHEDFLEKGYVIVDVEDREALDRIRDEVALLANGGETPSDPVKVLEDYHNVGDMDDFNARKMAVANGINEEEWLRPSVYSLTRNTINSLVGSQVAMQNKAILTVLMPRDKTSTLPIHADVFSGETSYQVNQWFPLVDVEGTMSMFYLEREYSEIALKEMFAGKYKSMADLFTAYEDKLKFITVPYGKQVIFCSNFLHGNVMNKEGRTRWAFHARYANIMSPFRSPEKSLGNFYRAELLRPVTQLGMAFDELKREATTAIERENITVEKVEYLQPEKHEIKVLRTYVSPRPFGPWRLPVPMQNILLRDYCEKNRKIIKLPANELNIEDNHMVLNMTLEGLEEGEGIAMCSLEMLPSNRLERDNLLLSGLNKGSEWHFIFENIVISIPEDIRKLNELYQIKSLKNENE